MAWTTPLLMTPSTFPLTNHQCSGQTRVCQSPHLFSWHLSSTSSPNNLPSKQANLQGIFHLVFPLLTVASYEEILMGERATREWH